MQEIINGVLINFEYVKKGEDTILFLHGWGGSIESFRFAQKYFENASNYSILNIDLPPFNKSGEPPESFTIYSYHDLIVNLLKKLNITKIHVVGHSFGGRIAVLLGAFNKEMVKSLTLVAAAGIKPRKSLKVGLKILNYKIKKRLFKNSTEKLKNSGSSDYRALNKNMKKVFISVVNENLTKYLNKIEAPTLIIWDKSDTQTPYYMAKKFKKHIKQSEIILLQSGGHFCHLYNSNKFLKILSSFFKSMEDK